MTHPTQTCVTAALAALLLAAPVQAHEGHDHGAPAEAAPDWAPRATARSQDFDLVAVLAGDQLVLWLDRARDNAPPAEASIEAESGAWKGVATAAADGSLRLPAGPLATPGRHEVIFTVQAGGAMDLLPATLVVPAPTPAAPGLAGGYRGWIAGGLAVALLGAVGWRGYRHSRRQAGRAAS
ncbi:MAG: hypothetical protein PHW25_09190 [Zoogloea sp.]|uniref:hypothetical protein n=1 Tax=Zoogloea sp. TaxID=49181 RepID=UPI00261C6173|nr:hypothetical protein [Zoogloea sp.]MDD3327242.1 hypothetical protein [Zoogloea sp.]